MKRNLRAAASNLKVPQKDQVEFLLEGDESKMEEILSAMREGKKLNSWGAQVDRLEELAKEDAMQLEDHKVTTDNVDGFNWSKNVEFFI